MTYKTGAGDILKTLDDVVARIKEFFDVAPEAEFEIMIGTDAQSYSGKTVYATAIVAYQKRKGGIYFINSQTVRGRRPLIP